MLRPTHRITDGAGAFGTRVLQERLGNVEKSLLGRTAHILDQLRSVAGIVLEKDLENAARILQGRIFFRPRTDEPFHNVAETFLLAVRRLFGCLLLFSGLLGVIAPILPVVFSLVGIES